MVTEKDIIADMHTHTVFSGHAHSTVYENIQAAKSQGIKYVAVTDHYFNDGTEINKKNETGRILYMEEDINPYLKDDGMAVISSAEFNIGQEVYAWDKMQALRWKPIGLHGWFFDIAHGSLPYLASRFHEAADKGFNCFCHIEREIHKVDYGAYREDILHQDVREFLTMVCNHALNHGIYLEVNENSLIVDECGGRKRIEFWLSYAKENGNMISLGSDAHYCGKVGRFGNAIELLNRVGFPKERILNCNRELLEGLVNPASK